MKEINVTEFSFHQRRPQTSGRQFWWAALAVPSDRGVSPAFCLAGDLASSPVWGLSLACGEAGALDLGTQGLLRLLTLFWVHLTSYDPGISMFGCLH